MIGPRFQRVVNVARPVLPTAEELIRVCPRGLRVILAMEVFHSYASLTSDLFS